MKNVIVRKSRIHGKGVFAARSFRKNEVVINWSTCSTTLTKEQVDVLSDTDKRCVSYIGEGKYVLFKSPGKYVNHSCDPNTNAINGCDVAVREIKEGDEITADYVLEKVPVLDFKCKCGSRNCKGIVKADS